MRQHRAHQAICQLPHLNHGVLVGVIHCLLLLYFLLCLQCRRQQRQHSISTSNWQQAVPAVCDASLPALRLLAAANIMPFMEKPFVFGLD